MGSCVRKPKEDLRHTRTSFAPSSSTASNVVRSRPSLVSNLFSNYHLGKPCSLLELSEVYTEIQSEGSNAWNISMMTIDFQQTHDGRNFDGLRAGVLSRDDIALTILKALIANGADPKTFTSQGGRTAFQVAALAGDLEFCKELVEKGVDINKVDEAGETALSLAREHTSSAKDLSGIISYLEQLT
jgi:hypothetical protein